jgi:hypothetical protein
MVKCADCGFLAGRDLESRQLVEVTVENRKTGIIPTHHKYPDEVYSAFPLCFAQAWPLQDEAKSKQQADILTVIQRERECDKFVRWRQGFTPKEHQEMIDQQELKRWQVEQRREDRKWQVVWGVILVLVAGAFTILGAILGAYLSRSH